MATLDDVLDGMVVAIENSLEDVPELYSVYKGWPIREELLQDLAAKRTNITVYPGPHGGGSSAPFIPVPIPVDTPIVRLAAAVSARKLRNGAPGVKASATITFSGSVVYGTVVMLRVARNAVSVQPMLGDSLSAVAAKVAAALNADDAIKQLVTATATDAVVTIEAKEPGFLGNLIELDVKIGGLAHVKSAIRTQIDEIQVHIWAPSDDHRALFSKVLDLALADHTWIHATEDHEAVRCLFSRHFQNDSEVKHGIFRRILYYNCQYPTTKVEKAMQVLDAQVTWGA